MNERPRLGGTDGIRGPAELTSTEPGVISGDTFAGLSASLTRLALDERGVGPVVVARDTRESGYELTMAVIDGVRSQGADVIDLDIAPTPAAQWTAQHIGAIATIVVTASHNKHTDNGWKGMIGSAKPSKDVVHAISDGYWERVESGLSVPRFDDQFTNGERAKLLLQYGEAIVNDVRREFGSEKPLDRKIIVVDGAYGAGKDLTPVVLTELGATVETFACGEGIINENCGAANLSGLKEFLQSRPDLIADPNFLGAVANDGDADRMMGIGVTWENNELSLVEINGNHVMWAMADGQPGIVGTDYTNSGLKTRLENELVGFDYCENGDVNVTNKLLAKQAAGKNWTRGGEFTGHQVDTKWLSSGDGVRMAGWFAAWAVKQGMTFGDIYTELPLWHETMAKIELGGKPGLSIANSIRVTDALEYQKSTFGSDGRFILRPSGTEPVIRVWGEAIEAQRLQYAVEDLAAVVSDVRDAS